MSSEGNESMELGCMACCLDDMERSMESEQVKSLYVGNSDGVSVFTKGTSFFVSIKEVQSVAK